jgi:hypothetical protein
MHSAEAHTTPAHNPAIEMKAGKSFLHDWKKGIDRNLPKVDGEKRDGDKTPKYTIDIVT